MYCFLLVLLLSVSSAAGGVCRQDWELYQERCYGFGEERLTWGDAEEMCRTAGARLAEIETAEENEFLMSQARQKKGGGYWIGGTDIFHEGSWVWLASGNLVVFSDWAKGQPDDAGNHEDCLELYGRVDYHWNDHLCDFEQQFICEAEPHEEPVIG